MLKHLILLLSIPLLALSACTKPVAAPDIRIDNAIIRPPAPGQTTAVAYFEVINNGGPDRLVSVRTPISPNAELHTHLHEDGIMKMRRVDLVEISGNATILFQPGGDHVMLFDAAISSEADSVSITLSFEISGDVQIDAMVSE